MSGSGLKKSESRCKWNTNEQECVGVHESEQEWVSVGVSAAQYNLT